MLIADKSFGLVVSKYDSKQLGEYLKHSHPHHPWNVSWS